MNEVCQAQGNLKESITIVLRFPEERGRVTVCLHQPATTL